MANGVFASMGVARLTVLKDGASRATIHWRASDSTTAGHLAGATCGSASLIIGPGGHDAIDRAMPSVALALLMPSVIGGNPVDIVLLSGVIINDNVGVLAEARGRLTSW